MDQLKKLLLSLPVRQRWTIAIFALAIGGGVTFFSHWQRESGFRPLFGSLSAEDASAMAQKLREGGVEYRIAENGTMLMVPEDRVPELRLEMAGLGLPKTGRIGFEIFDKTNFGITDFAEHVNYRRAVEGELERSIMALSEVQQARVHVSLPKESVFTESREPAKASVLVGLKPGMMLDAQNITAIVNLISSAVEGLQPQAVSVVDMRGNVLNRPRPESLDGEQVSEAALDYRQAIEHELTAKINNTLEPLLGADRFRTGVSADVDMTSGEQNEETFDPTKSVMVTSQRTEDSNTNTHTGAAAGPPGTAANLPQPPHPAGNTTGSSRKTENITYQSSRTTKHVKLPQGTVKRLSVAVLVDQTVKWEGQGTKMHRVLVPPEPEKMKSIQGLVSTLVGLNSERGDQITVETMPFDTTLNMEPPGTAAPHQDKKPAEGFSIETIKNKPVIWGSAAGGVLLLTVMAFFMGRRKTVTPAVAVPQSLPPAPSRALATMGQGSAPVEMEQGGAHDGSSGSRLPALLPSRTEVLIKQLQDSGKNSPELWAGVLRSWLSEEDAG